jgi:cobalamin biosynthetic protein CobC
MAVPGSQAAIRGLPGILCADGTVKTVAVLSPSYAEHSLAWETAGAQVQAVTPERVAASVESAADRIDALVLCNPNNPTGHRWTVDELLALRAQLAARGGWLIVDEAFVDATPELSLAAHAGTPGLIILRSMGKFFGLAGARVGFVLAPQTVRERLQCALGPWAIAGPSEAAAATALANTAFHARARSRLGAASQRLRETLRNHGFAVAGHTHYFTWTRHARARQLQNHFAHEGILIRVFDQPASFRLGLPGTAAAWRRFVKVLEHVQQLPDCRND